MYNVFQLSITPAVTSILH